ncbi:MAG: O-antigen ligase family protein, partial [Geminicoccaceae bacterium]
IFSGSRAAMLSTVLLLIAYPLASKPFREQLYHRRYAILAGIVLVGMASLAYLPKVYMRLQLKMDRMRVWNVFYDEFLKSPIFGRGVGSGFIAGVDWPADVEPLFFPVPHNEYLHLLVNGGIVGFLLCMAAIIYWYYRLIRSTSDEDRLFLMALAPALAVFAITDNILIHAYAMALYIYLALVERQQPEKATSTSQPCSPTHHYRSASRKEERPWADGGNTPPQHR